MIYIIRITNHTMAERYCVDPAANLQWQVHEGTQTLTVDGEDGDWPIPSELVAVLDSSFRMRDRDEIIEELADVGLDDPEGVFSKLVRYGVLTADERTVRARRNWFEHKWHQSLLYHLRTRDGLPTRRAAFAQDSSNEGPSNTVELPEPGPLPDRALEDVLLDRRTSRYFDRRSISATDISSILYHWGDFVRNGNAEANSAAEYMEAVEFPCEVYSVVSRVEEVPKGVYRYNVKDHSFVPLDRTFDDSTEADRTLRDIVTNQPFVEDAAVGFLLAVDLEHVLTAYSGSRVLMHLMTVVSAHVQRLILLATSFGYDVFQSAAIDGRTASDVCKFDFPNEMVVYAVVIGDTEGVDDDDS